MPATIPTTVGICCLGYAALQGYARYGTAVSPEAELVRQAASAVARMEEGSQALFREKSSAISQLWAMASDCVEENWDGNGALAIEPLAIIQAEQFLRVLPNDIPVPEFSVEPDGAVSLDWIRSKDSIFSLSIGTNNRLAYAWLDEGDKGHAVARFDGYRVPTRILEGIKGITAYGNASLWVA
jgi:hypothetical protein